MDNTDEKKNKQISSENQIEVTTIDDLDMTLTNDDEIVLESLPSNQKQEPSSNNFNSKNRYTVIGNVGDGAMGEVLLAKDQDLRRKVAYKKIKSKIASNKKILNRFLTEAQITAQLEHSNIVPIYGLEVAEDGQIAYTMKLINGKTLKDLINEAKDQYQKEKKFDEKHLSTMFLDYFLKVCDAIDYSHKKGVIHRDLKPANIMIGPFHEVFVMDWGIAKLIKNKQEKLDDDIIELIKHDKKEPEFEKTRIGQILGSPRFMSPEQAKGKNDELDGKSDQYALGLILFELLTLKPALQAKSMTELTNNVIKAKLQPIAHFFPNISIPVELKAIIKKATAKNPKDRYDDVAAFADDIRRYLRGKAVLAKPDNFFQKITRLISQHRQTTLLVIMAILFISAISIALIIYKNEMSLRKLHAREKIFHNYIAEFATKSQSLENQFLKFEILMEGLATSVNQLLFYGVPINEKYYTTKDFLNPKRAPKDLAYSQALQMKISIDSPVIHIPKGIDKSKVIPIIKKMYPLRHTFKRLFILSYNKNAPFYPQIKQRKLILDNLVPLTDLFIGFNNGMLIAYPGVSTIPEDYDARDRPWYRQSLNKRGVNWLTPYIDSTRGVLALPCTMPIYNENNKLVCIAGIELTLDYLIDEILVMTNSKCTKEEFLINTKGQILISSSQERKHYKKGTLINKALSLKTFPEKKVIDAIKSKYFGYVQIKQNNIKNIFMFQKLSSTNFYYVVKVDEDLLYLKNSQD